MSGAEWEELKKKITYKIGDYYLNEDLELVSKEKFDEGFYSGQILNNKRSGIGYLKFKDGSKYFGIWENDKPHGNGFLKSNDTYFYRGEFKCGMFWGEGTYEEGSYRYSGSWHYDKKHGMGYECMANGDNYFGDFIDGKRHGYGTINLKNGGRVEGYFEKGVLVKGTYEFDRDEADRIRYEGYWKNGLFDGEGILIISPKENYIDRMEGKFSKGKFIEGNVFFVKNDRFKADVLKTGILRIDSVN
jgi:hypothetical protein